MGEIKGPILILGAGGFIGANLMNILSHNDNVWGTVRDLSSSKLDDSPNLFGVDLLVNDNLNYIFDMVHPKTVFNLLSYGAYPHQQDAKCIYQTNLILTARILELMPKGSTYIHAGSSSEYGENSNRPLECEMPTPNSIYAISKSAAASAIYYYGKHKGIRCANLRLYSVYGKYEQERRLIPTVIRDGYNGKLPPFVNPNISRDFIHVDDVCAAFTAAVENLQPENYGESFNIGTGVKTTIADVANTAKKIFSISEEPQYTMEPRMWDHAKDWYANPAKAKELLGWEAKIKFEEGFTNVAKLIS